MANFCAQCSTQQKSPAARFCWKCGAPLRPSQPTASTVSIPGASLVVRFPGQAPANHPLLKSSMTIGRAGDNDLVLNYVTVSNHHLRVEQRGVAYTVTDVGSTNGTTLNGRPTAAYQPCPLASGDVLRIGDMQGNSISLTFQDGGAATTGRGTQLIDPARLASAQITIGRDPQSSIPLASPMVSWHHAQIERTPQGDILTDLNSTNGTFVNGQRVTHHALRQGDVIQVGPFRVPFTSSGVAVAANVGQVRLDGVHLKRQVKDRKTGGVKYILNDVTLSIQPGEFVAVVGGSGAGKSTLMKALNGQSHADDGKVLLNGDDFYAHFDQYRLMMGYVPQDDIVHRDLSVENALRYAAQLRLPPDTQPAEIERRIVDVLTRLDMLDKRKDTIATLSGGQRKRVNIAVEMLADPDLFFLDEPSSGLDPGTEKKLMYDMQRVADAGKTVILITHATDNVDLCDHIAFMGYGGNLVFFGPPSEARKFFQAQSFADIYLKLNNPQDVLNWRAQYEQSSLYQQYVSSRIATPATPRAGAVPQRLKLPGLGDSLRQFGILTRRYLELIMRSKASLFVLLAVMPIIGLLLLMISQPFWLTGKFDPKCANVNWDAPDAIEQCIEFHLQEDLKQANSATYTIAGQGQVLLFMLAFASSLLGIFAAAFEIVKEKAIFERERMINLRLAPYLLSKFSVLGGFAIMQSLLLLAVISLGVRLPNKTLLLPVPVEFYTTLLLTIWASVGLGLLVSALVPNRDVVVYGMLLVLIVQIIFAGVLFKLPSEVQPISSITITKWSLNALGTTARLVELNQYGQSRVLPNIRKDVTKDVDVEVPDPRTGGKVKEKQEVTVAVEFNDPVNTRVAPKFDLPYGCSEVVTRTKPDGEAEEITMFDEACSRGSLIGDWLVLSVFTLGFVSLAAGMLRLKERMAH